MNIVHIIIIIAAYLIGSLSFAVIISKIMNMNDPRTYGSGNPGATNVLRSGNKMAAGLTLLGDALKGFVPILLLLILKEQLQLPPQIIALSALFILIGHMWPIFFKFKGGKGVATAIGILFALSWPTALICLVIWVIIAFGLKISSLAAIVATIACPTIATFFVTEPAYIYTIIAITLLVLLRHRSNITNLLAGKETKIGH